MTQAGRRSRRRRIVLWAVAATLVALAVAVDFLIVRQESTPPPLAPQASDVQRITIIREA